MECAKKCLHIAPYVRLTIHHADPCNLQWVQDFNWNYGIAQAAEHHYEEAEKALLLVSDEAYTSEYTYIAW